MRLAEMIYTEEDMNELREENKTLKDKIEFLTNCLDDRDKSIEIMKEENKKLKEELEKYKIENKKLRNSLNMKESTIVGLKHQVKKLEKGL